MSDSIIAAIISATIAFAGIAYVQWVNHKRDEERRDGEGNVERQRIEAAAYRRAEESNQRALDSAVDHIRRLESRVAQLEEYARAADVRATQVEERAKRAEVRADLTEARAVRAERRADVAEQIARDAERRAGRTEERADRDEERAENADERATAIEERAVRAENATDRDLND